MKLILNITYKDLYNSFYEKHEQFSFYINTDEYDYYKKIDAYDMRIFITEYLNIEKYLVHEPYIISKYIGDDIIICYNLYVHISYIRKLKIIEIIK